MTVKAKITSSSLPEEVDPSKSFPWSIGIETTGSGKNYIGGALFEKPVSNGDNPADAAHFALTDQAGNLVPVPPGKSLSGTVPVNPVEGWKTPVPDTLSLKAWSVDGEEGQQNHSPRHGLEGSYGHH